MNEFKFSVQFVNQKSLTKRRHNLQKKSDEICIQFIAPINVMISALDREKKGNYFCV